MQITKPNYYDAFRCLAGACPDTCCANWEVVIDPESLAFYQSVPGALGAQLRDAMEPIDSEVCFGLRDGLCRLLRPDGLCPIQRELGEEHLCAICGSYPRFSTEIGLVREVGLSLSCPEAARRIVAAREPLTLVCTRDDAPMTALHELSPELILATRQVRTLALEAMQDRSLPFPQRCARMLALCAPVARAAEARRDRQLAAALENAPRPAPAPASEAGLAHLRAALAGAFSRCTPLVPERKERLLTALSLPMDGPWEECCPALPQAWEQLACYCIYKYFPRSVFDRRLWSAAVFSAVFPLAVRQLLRASGSTEAEALLRLSWTLSRELEHSEENMALLFAAFAGRSFRENAMRAAFAAMG